MSCCKKCNSSFFYSKFLLLSLYVKYRRKVGELMSEKNLKELREEKGLYQWQVAEYSNISSSYYCMIEKGKRNPSLKTAEKISEALNISLDIFYRALILTVSQYYPKNIRGEINE